MARVFISYASEDRTLAGELHQWLSHDGHKIFWDHDPHNGIAVGEQWKQRIHERLHWAALRRLEEAWPDGRCPFPGLLSFQVDQHQVFFGRAAETDELAELLWSPAERFKGAALLVVGPSGCGKSSLVRAGLVPVMAREPGWLTLAPIMPGADPVATLVRELVDAAKQFGLGWSVPQLRDRLDEGGRSRAEVIRGLLRLVTVNEQGHPIRWRVRRDELPAAVSTELDVFVAKRLLTIDIDHDTAVIGVAHEAFLSAWPPLAGAITTSGVALRARRAVEDAASEWHEHGRLPTWLWGGGQLAAAVTNIGARTCPADAAPPGRRGWSRWLPRRRVLVTDRVDLDAQARDFVLTSMRHDRYLRRRLTIVLSGLVVVALTAAGRHLYPITTERDGLR
ncbi:MAG: TIR domain-containing protein [Pseudonocardiaceae bacterium]